ncbi:hypothetical protein PRK78_005163 [Emydomyces testavorans]|uniref:Major facilitator superfamily (MFS) profile domain-containing protein n=1 Tax=Emydomyces testavorans TaxID=2070801 RepID=A0AAF0IMD1_9EURO|nr:hypothetical protein PRK78_005163 [Emydomyces testavorans]
MRTVSSDYRDGDDDDCPLLADAELPSPIDDDSSSYQPPPITLARKTGRRSPAIFVLLCALASFALDFGAYLNVAPQTRIFEDIVCRNYYDKHEPGRFTYGEIPEEQCKIKPVQGEVAFVQAMISSFDAIPSIILLIPYGRLADNPKFGRKIVLLMSILGLLLNFYWTVFVSLSSRVLPLRAIWFGSVFNIIGGGLGVTNAMVITMITDIVEPDNRYVGKFASGLMALKGPWLPFLLGMLVITMSCPFLFVLPETIQLRPPQSKTRQSMDTEDSAVVDDLWLGQTPSLSQPRKLLNQAWESSKFIFQSRAVVLILSTFFLSVIGRKQLDILLLYVSTRYSIPISQAAFSLSVSAGGNIFLLLILLPLSSRYLTKTLHFSPSAKDLYLSKISVVLLTIGCFALGLSPTIPTMIAGLIIYTLGCGFNPLCLSLISTFVEPRHAARLYSIVCLISMAGALIGGPLLAGLFNWGLSIGPGWTGLPFLGTGLIHVFVVIAVSYIKLPRTAIVPEEAREEEE